MLEAVATVGDRLAVFPTLFHLLWTGEVTAELHGAPLSFSTPLVTLRRAA